MRRRQWWAAAIAVVLTTGIVGGCAANSSAPEKSQVEAQAQINPRPASEVADGGNLTLPLQQVPQQWNYLQTDGPLLDTSTILEVTRPRVFAFDQEGTQFLDKNFVTRAELTSTDPQTVEYTINEKAQWNDGTPITWRDFETEWRVGSGQDPAFQLAGTGGLEDVASVERGATDKEVKVVYARNFADWQSTFTLLYPSNTIDTPEKFNTGWLNKIPKDSGAGPFTLDEADINLQAQTVTVRRNEKWWGDRPKLDTITYRALSAEADIDAYLNKEIDAVPTAVGSRFSRVKSAPDTAICVSSSPAFNHITFGSGGVLGDTATRVAVARAIDRSQLMKTAYAAIPYDVQTLNNHLYLQSNAGYQDNSASLGYDPKAAAAELEKAGWKLEGKVRKRDGQALEPRLVIPAGNPATQNLSELLQKQLAEVGVEVKITTVSQDSFFRDTVTPGNFDLTIFIWVGTGYVSSATNIYRAGENTQNFGKIENTEISDLLNQSNRTLDPAESRKLRNQADEQLWAEAFSLPIAQAPTVIAAREGIANYGAPAGNGALDWTKVGWVKK